MQLSVSTKSPVTHIFHFADIHIRNGDVDRSRYEEYRQVFDTTCKHLEKHKAIKDQTGLIVIAGDVFHHKGKIDTPALKLYFEWMDRMLTLSPVVMICGNHDFRQEDPRHPDMLETVVLPYIQQHPTKHKLYYLKDTGLYEYDNVGFGVVSIKDTLRTGNTSGLVDDLPTFPSPSGFSNNVTRKYALFHGTVTQSALPNDTRVSKMSGYPLQWFQEYDGVILGDNHKQQVNNDKYTNLLWGYPGSLIQQDFGKVRLAMDILYGMLQRMKPNQNMYQIRTDF